MLDNNDIIKLSEVLVTKEDLKEEIDKLVTKQEFNEFKNTSLSKLDEILEGVESLKQEKIFKDEQDRRQKLINYEYFNFLTMQKWISNLSRNTNPRERERESKSRSRHCEKVATDEAI